MDLEAKSVVKIAPKPLLSAAGKPLWALRCLRACCVLMLTLWLLLLTGCVRSEPPADLVIVNGNEPESRQAQQVVHCLVGELRLARSSGDGARDFGQQQNRSDQHSTAGRVLLQPPPHRSAPSYIGS